MNTNLWQFDTLERLRVLLHEFEAVQAVIVVGSLANDAVQPDFWSDIDLVVVVKDEDIDRFYPETDWLKPINAIYATSQSEEALCFTSRVCFSDMRRLDLIFVPASAFDDQSSWTKNPFDTGYHILFSKLSKVEKTLVEGFSNLPKQNDPVSQFSAMSNAFWFKGMLAVYKVVRNDLLIALHLVLDLMRDCLVLKMMLRDREQGTTHHRIGGAGNELVAQMNAQSLEFSAAGILEMIKSNGLIFDNLAKEWSPNYAAKRFSLQTWIAWAKEDLTQVRS